MARGAVTARLAEFVSEADWRSLPADVRAMARNCLLDWFAAAVAGSREKVLGPFERVVSQFGELETASIVGSDLRCSAPHAAMVNGTLSHVLELDDVHHGAAIHGSAVSWAAALAMGQSLGATAREATLAFALGYEVMARIGLPCGQRMMREHHHATGVLGYFGAGATAGRLLELNPLQQAMVFGAVAGQAGALTQVRGTMSKSFFAGHSAHGGVLSALLVKQGFTSATDAIEGEQGVLATFGGDCDPEVVIDGIGSRWELLRNAFKVHASCAMSHALIDGILELRERHALQEQQVMGIELRLYSHATEYLDKPRVADGLSAKFSAQYCAAVALLDGAAQEGQFLDARVEDARLHRVMERVRLAPDRRHGMDQASVVVNLRDGRRLQIDVREVLGSHSRPLTRTKLEDKARLLLGRALPAERVAVVLDLLARWPECEIDDLFESISTRH